MDETTLDMLVALAEACEGNMTIEYAGISKITTDDELNVTIHTQDGRQLPPEQVDARQLEDAVFHWRQEHPAFFQRILGAMM